MKRFVSTLILLLFVVASAAAQSTNSIIINQDSFRAIQSDELTGLILDPIGQDHSRRPCARIKMRINRMTAEQINELQLEIITNNELTRFQTATASNGLIIEMTAKSQSRFYLKHSKFGYSNEVMLNLEGNKEYYIEAELVQQFPITIATNVANADIYINNQYKGTSNDNFYLIVEDMLAGDYDLSLKYAGKEYTQKIKVTTSSVYFKQDVELNRVTTQYLIVNVLPKGALVEIEGEPIEITDGKGRKLLQQGTYQYKVSANRYHEQRGTVTISEDKVELNISLEPAFGYLKVENEPQYNGAQLYVNNRQMGTLPLEKPVRLDSQTHSVKVVKSLYHSFEQEVAILDGQTTTIKPTLRQNYAVVTITAQNNAEIWIDGEYKDSGSWTGKLEIGPQHELECRKKSHKTAYAQLNILSTRNEKFDFDPLEPICGTLNIDNNVIGANIAIDGVKVGTTPLIKSDVLVGRHTVTISQEGYNTITKTVDIVENQTVNITDRMTVKKVATAEKKPSYISPVSAGMNLNSTTKKNYTKNNSYSHNKNMVLFGLGFDFAFPSSDSYYEFGLPLFLRVGNCNQIVNCFLGARVSWLKEKKDVYSSENAATISTQVAPMAKLRFNALRATNTSIFCDLGAAYNFNTLSSLNRSVSIRGDVGWDLQLFDFSIFGTYYIQPDVFFWGVSCNIYFNSGFFK